MTSEAQMLAKAQRPIPVPDPRTEPYWQAANQGKLAIQRCTDCGRYNHPPVPMCPTCHTSKLEFTPVSGRGKIYGRAIFHQASVASFQPAVPYTVVAVELEEQPELIVIANLVDGSASDAEVGRPVEVTFEPLTEGIRLPQFKPRKA